MGSISVTDRLCVNYISVKTESVADPWMDTNVIIYCGIITSVELCNFHVVRMLSIYIMNHYMYKIHI